MTAKRIAKILLNVVAFVSCPILAQSQCEAYFPLDGNLNDASGNGYDGRMIAAEGKLAKPQFVDGKVGKALQLDGTSAMRAFVDLNYETCKQVTMTAWVMFEPGRPSKTVNIISTGGGSGPGLATSGAVLTLKGTANGLMQSNAIRENAGWMFVAGVYDYSGDKYTLYWRGRSESKALGPHLRMPEEAIWIGALNDRLSGAASGVVVDELRIYGRLLSDEELRGMQAQRVPGFAAEQTIRQVASNTCAAQSDCGPGSYCAFDRTCHPESHLPLREIDLTLAPAPTQTVIPALSSDGQDSSGSSSSMPGVIPGVADRFPANSGLSEKAYDALQDKVNESRPPEIGYASEEEALAAAERRERAAYEAELSRQQNELEGQRREAEAQARTEAESIAGAADGSAGTVSTPDSSNGSGVAIGGIELSNNFIESGISGISGAIIQRVDLEVFPMKFVSIDENNDKPCEIIVANGSFSEKIDRCGVGFSFNRARKLEKDGRWGVTALRIGDDYDVSDAFHGRRVKALWLEFAKFDDSGGLSDIRDTDSWTLSGFGQWKQVVRCPDGHVATGIVAHMYPGKAPSAGTDFLAGLKLICREVVSGN